MSENSNDSYRVLLRDYLATTGRPVSLNPSYYNGWEDSEAEMHAGPYSGFDHPCGWVIAEDARITEDTVVEWGGTFGEDSTEYTVDVIGASCRCGLYTHRTLRIQSTFGDFLRTVLGNGASIPL